MIEHYEKNKNTIQPPKYLFNKVCYEKCPSSAIHDDSNNSCKYEFEFHKENEITIRHKIDYW